MVQESDPRLLRLFATEPESVPLDGFETEVMRRIGRIRRRRLTGRTLAFLLLAIAAFAVSPIVVDSAGYIAEASGTLSEAVGKVVSTPVAFAIGIVTTVYALLELRSR